MIMNHVSLVDKRLLSLDSAVPLTSMNLFSIFQLILLVLWQLYCSGSFVFYQHHKEPLCSSSALNSGHIKITVETLDHLTAKEPHISLRSWWRAKTELKGEWTLYLLSSVDQKYNSKWMLMLLCNSWIYKYNCLLTSLSHQHKKVMSVLWSCLISAAPKWPMHICCNGRFF